MKKNDNSPIRARALIIRDKHVLMIRRSLGGREFLVFPGGHVEAAEEPSEALVREIKEETSLTVVEAQLALDCHLSTEGSREMFFLVTVGDGDPVLGGDEAIRNIKGNSYTLEWCHLDAICEQVVLPEYAKYWLVQWKHEST